MVAKLTEQKFFSKCSYSFKQFTNISEVLNILQATVTMKLSKKINNKKNKNYLNDALMISIVGISAAIKNTE